MLLLEQPTKLSVWYNKDGKKEAEEKEAEKKVNTVWDAIKEIQDLEENDRFDAMNSVHQFGMKDAFMSMTREESFRWIKCSLRKPWNLV